MCALAACGGSDTSVSVNISSLDVQASPVGTQPYRRIAVTVRNLPSDGIYVGWDQVGEGLTFIDAEYVSDQRFMLNFYFEQPNPEMAGHEYRATAQFDFCHDSACSRPAKGSPLQIQTSYRVTDAALPEPGLTAVQFLDHRELTHDVVDAAFSAALDSVVIASSQPAPALYRYDMGLGTRHETALTRSPTSLSVSPNGLHAAVGHDALITHVDLATLGEPGAQAPRIFPVSTDARTVLLDGTGRVYVISSSSANLHTVDVATGAEQITSASTGHQGASARLHPTGSSFYFATRPNRVPSSIGKYDVPLSEWHTMPHRPPHHGRYEMCHDLWMDEPGAHIYTACGHRFISSDDPDLDMVHSGRLALSDSGFAEGYRIFSLSHSEAMKEIAVIEGDWRLCAMSQNTGACYTRLGIHASDSLHRTGVYSIPAASVDGIDHPQRGTFVFHGANGAHLYVITELHGSRGLRTAYLATIR